MRTPRLKPEVEHALSSDAAKRREGQRVHAAISTHQRFEFRTHQDLSLRTPASQKIDSETGARAALRIRRINEKINMLHNQQWKPYRIAELLANGPSDMTIDDALVARTKRSYSGVTPRAVACGSDAASSSER